jgi:hypothetical protein
MNQQEAPTGVGEFLRDFGVSMVLWRLLQEVGYTEAPKYQWSRTILRGQPWYEVVVRIPERARKPSWPHWMFHAEGMTPWEGAQVTALEVLTTICYQKWEEIQATSMRLFPAVALSDPVVYHHQARLMENIPIGQDSVESASARVLMAVLELQLTRGHSRQMWQQLYTGSYAAFKMMEMVKNRACTQAQEQLEETKIQAERIIGLEHQVTELQTQHQVDQHRIKELEHQLTNAHSKSKVLSQQQEEIRSYAVTVREELKETMGFLSHQDQVLEELHRTYPMEFQIAQRLVNHLQQTVHMLNGAFYSAPTPTD